MDSHWIEKTHKKIQSSKNQIDFALRHFLGQQKHAKKRYTELAENHDNLFSDRLTPEEWRHREQALLTRYELLPFKSSTTTQRYLENLSILEHLDYIIQHSHTSITKEQTNQTLSLLDVGCKNWSYIKALHTYFSQWDKNISLEGIELDAYRRYMDGFYRADYAHHYIEHLPNAQYHVGDVMSLTAPVDMVTCFLPFVFEEPCLAWGLPLEYFQPQAFFDHLLDLVKPNGMLIIINQEKEEYQAQQQLIRHSKHANSLIANGVGKLPETFYPYQHERYGWVIRKSLR